MIKSTELEIVGSETIRCASIIQEIKNRKLIRETDFKFYLKWLPSNRFKNSVEVKISVNNHSILA